MICYILKFTADLQKNKTTNRLFSPLPLSENVVLFPFLAFEIWSYQTQDTEIRAITTSSSLTKNDIPENPVGFILKPWYCLELGRCGQFYSTARSIWIWNKNIHHDWGNFHCAHLHYVHLRLNLRYRNSMMWILHSCFQEEILEFQGS